ncbi:MAG: hypothetical protein EBR99_06815, partial [Actinobacteria bacterium]|nr:hypothetical protein [Actinomycetota bacterium]
ATSVGTASAATTAAVVFGNASTTGGTLIYLGAGETSDRALTSLSTTGGITIEASGTGPLVLNGTFTNSNAAAAAKTLSLNGYGPGVNLLNSTLTNNTGGGGGALSITKNGGGVWVITGNNTGVSGGTVSLSGGVLGVGHNNALGTDTISWSNGMIMAYGADRTLSNAVTLNANNTWGVMGDYGLTFSSVANWGSGTTTYSNNFYNNLTGGKVLTFGGGFNSAFGATGTNTNTITIIGTGTTILTGAITQTTGGTLNGITLQGSVGGTMIFNGNGTNTMAGPFTQTSGTLKVARTGAFAAFSNYTFTAGYLQNTYGSALTGVDALIPVAGILNLNGTQLYLNGSGAAASIEVAGQFNDGAGSRILYSNLSSGAQLTLSGTINLSSDATARVMTINGKGDGIINLTGVFAATSLATSTTIAGTFVKGALGDLNIAPTSSLNAPVNGNLVVSGGTASFRTAN